MRFSDFLSGSIAALFGIALVAYVRSFPPMPGQSVGPGLFPTMIGAGLIVFGAALAISAARRPRTALIELGDWVVKPRMVLNFALVIADRPEIHAFQTHDPAGINTSIADWLATRPAPQPAPAQAATESST